MFWDIGLNLGKLSYMLTYFSLIVFKILSAYRKKWENDRICQPHRVHKHCKNGLLVNISSARVVYFRDANVGVNKSKDNNTAV